MSSYSSLKLEHCTHSDAADRLRLMCCNSQKSTEWLRALLHAEKLQKHMVEPSLAPEKVDTILSHPLRTQKSVQCTVLGRIKTCSKTPPDMKEHPRVIESRLFDLKEAIKSHEVGTSFHIFFFLKGN